MPGETPEPAGSAGRQGRRRAGGGEWEADPINLKLLFFNVLSHFGGWGWADAGSSLLPGRFSNCSEQRTTLVCGLLISVASLAKSTGSGAHRLQ